MTADVPILLDHVLAVLDSGGADVARTAVWLREQNDVVATQSSLAVPSESLANIYSTRARRTRGAVGMKEAADELRIYAGLVDLLWLETAGGFAAVFVRSDMPSRVVASFYVNQAKPVQG